MTNQSSAIAVEVVSDKHLTKRLLAAAFISVPPGVSVASEEEAVQALHSLGGPVVVKPLDGRQGNGVSLNLCSETAVRKAFALARDHSRTVVVEQFLRGRNYRVLVVGNRLVAASERMPPQVTGDGERPLRDLIACVNEDPRRGDAHEKPLTRIVVDEIVLETLGAAGLTLDAVPGAGHAVTLRESANLSTGGTATDVTALVHDDIASVCERAARTLGLDVAGIDLVLDDIARPLDQQSGGVIEVNAAPGLRMHCHPSAGEARAVGDAIVDMLFPAGTVTSVPLVATTGTNGKTTTTRMIGHVLAATGRTVGMTTTDGISIGGRVIARGDMTGPRSAYVVLGDPAVDVAVLETARGGIVRGGLGWSWADVGVVTNIEADHIGQDGIRSLDDLVHIKSLLAERVREGGTLVLNAEDPRVAALATRPAVARVPKWIVYFGLDGDHPVIRRHRAANGSAFFVERSAVVAATGSRQRRVMELATIPATLGGLAAFNVGNMLAAIAALEPLGVTPERAAASLARFSSPGDNPGRANLYRLRDSLVMVDYGHNAHAFAAVGRAASQIARGRLIGVIAVPGDRADDVIAAAGRTAGSVFDCLVIKEDRDLRGRVPGEVARLLCEAALAASPQCECRVVLEEATAISRGLAELNPGDMAVVFYDDFAVANDVLGSFGAVAITGLAEELAAAA
jgi:cyanophycin synthetase